MPSVDELLEGVYGIRVIRDHPYMPGYVLLVNVRALEPRPDPNPLLWKVRFGWDDHARYAPLRPFRLTVTP